MRNVTLVRGARQLLTLRGPSGPRRGTDARNLGIIEDGAVLIADGVIREVGPSRRLENLQAARGATEIDASGCVVLPGLVDPRAQLIREEPRHLSPRALKALALRALEEGVRSGTTAFGVKSGELKILRVYAALRELPLTLVSTFIAPSPSSPGDAKSLAMVRRRKWADFLETTSEEPPPITILVPDFESERPAIDSAAAIALATAPNPANMQVAIALASRTMGLTPAEAITAATINGAHAIRRTHEIGSLEAGKSADLVILAVPDYRELPYHFGVNLANLVMIRGTVLVERARVKWPK